MPRASLSDRRRIPAHVSYAVVALLACGPLRAQNHQFVVTAETGVVREQSAKPDIRLVCSRSFPAGLSGYWRPTASDLRPLEAALPAYLARKIPERWRPPTREIRIYRQYVGMCRAGRRVIYVNGVGHEDLNWQTETIVVCDGGPTNFGAVFDVEQAQFTEFSGNTSF